MRHYLWPLSAVCVIVAGGAALMFWHRPIGATDAARVRGGQAVQAARHSNDPHEQRPQQETAGEWGPTVVRSKAYRVELAELRPTRDARGIARVSVALERRDGKPVAGDVTFDTRVTDNRCTWHNVGCVYGEFGAAGEEVSRSDGDQAYRIVQTLEIGPLHERIRWLDIEVTIYKRSPKPGEEDAFLLNLVETVSLGKHRVPGTRPTAPARWVELVGYRVPAYPGAGALEVFSAAGAHWGNAVCTVRGVVYPSQDVAAFYDEWAVGHGWVRKTVCREGWQDFIDATQDGEPWVYRLSREWTNEKSGKRLVLVCQYRLPKDQHGGYAFDVTQPWAKKQIVMVGIYPPDKNQ